MKKTRMLLALICYAWKDHKMFVLTVVIESVFSALLPLINVTGIGVIIDELLNGNHKSVFRVIMFFSFINLGVSLCKCLFTYLHSVLARKASDKIQYDYIKDGIFINYHWAQDGSVLDMKKKSMGANPIFAFAHIGHFIDYIIKFSGILYIFSLLSPYFILVIAVTSTVSILFTFKLRRIDYDYENDRIENDRKSSYLYNIMTQYEYAKEVRLNNIKPFIIQKNDNLLKEQLQKLKKYIGAKLIYRNLSLAISLMQSAIMYIYLSYCVSVGNITIAQYSVLLGAVTLLTSILVGFFDKIAIVGRVVARMEIFLEYKEWVNKNSDIIMTNRIQNADMDDQNIEIRFENVSFVYPDTKKYVLKNLNFVIKKGQKVGIVGLNGSGKTTIVKLLLRLYSPTEGRILINNIDLNMIPIDQYLKYMGAVLQDFHIFAYSIKENITFDKNISQNTIEEAIIKSGIYKKINTLKNGIDTILYKDIDANGVELSGGESQKLALARALCKNAKIMILDEPTSTLDPIAEYEMFSNLHDISEGKTVIFISHRLSSTRFCDKILVLQNGMIAEEGTYCELIKQGGIYANMFESQAKYYRENGVKI